MLLLIDADDTLWENNVYFERVIEQFIAFVNHSHLSPQEVRAILDDVERANAKVHGYGSASFARNLQQAYCHLVAGASEAQLEHVHGLGAAIATQELEIIEGVRETLEYLAPWHHLVMLTKGNEEEQRAKIERSGLAGFFQETIIVHEKDADTYRRLSADLGSKPDETWMIGNSPRSDVNPALAAGLNAVWVPHSNTWVLEHEDLASGPGRLVIVSRFSELRNLF